MRSPDQQLEPTTYENIAAMPPKYMHFTSTHPTDVFPIDQMLDHQVKQLSLSSSRFFKKVVFDNRPSWWTFNGARSPQDPILQMLKSRPDVDVRKIDYKQFDDPSFLGSYFQVDGAPSATLRTLFPFDTKHFMKTPHYHQQQFASNFLSMLNVLDACVKEPTSFQFCVYADPDMFVTKSAGRSMVDVAASILTTRPDIIVLTGPEACGLNSAMDKKFNHCKINDYVSSLSSRLLIIDRQKLKRHLPLQVSKSSFPRFFEEIFLEGLQRVGTHTAKQMICADFAGYMIHPPNDHQIYSLLMANSGVAVAKGSTHEDPDSTQFDQVETNGLKTLIQRFEAGKFQKSSIIHCSTMDPHYDQIRRGMAW